MFECMFDTPSKHPPTDTVKRNLARPRREIVPSGRTQAVAVTATLASWIETTIEELVSRILADYVEKAPETDGT
jgi:hypothetical protein